MAKEVKVQGQMDNTQDHTFEILNRVYFRGGQSPTITTGGNTAPKTIRKIHEVHRDKTSN